MQDLTQCATCVLPNVVDRFDLQVAIGLLNAADLLDERQLDHHEFAGENLLTSDLRPTRRTLAISREANGRGPQADPDRRKRRQGPAAARGNRAACAFAEK